MLVIPRSSMSRNRGSRKRFAASKELASFHSSMETLCKRHNIGELKFRNCKNSKADGTCELLTHSTIKGNVKTNIMVVNVTSATPSQIIYDLVDIHNKKVERDRIKNEKQRELEKPELERHARMAEEEFKRAQEKANKPLDVSTEHLIDSIKTQSGIDSENDTGLDEHIQETEDPDPESDDDTENKSESQPEPKPTRAEIKSKKLTQKNKEKIDNKIKKAQQTRAENEQKRPNKAIRKFKADLEKMFKTKFSLNECPDLKYFEFKMDTAEMVVEDGKIYKISNEINDHFYYVIIGDLMMKSQMLRNIDPTYNMDKSFFEQTEFLERINAQNKLTVKESEEEIVPEEPHSNTIRETSAEPQEEIVPEVSE